MTQLRAEHRQCHAVGQVAPEAKPWPERDQRVLGLDALPVCVYQTLPRCLELCPDCLQLRLELSDELCCGGAGLLCPGDARMEGPEFIVRGIVVYWISGCRLWGGGVAMLFLGPYAGCISKQTHSR